MCSQLHWTAWWKQHFVLLKQYLDRVCTEQGGRPGSPEQLTEAVLVVLLKKTALECPQPVGIVHLNTHKKNTRLREKDLSEFPNHHYWIVLAGKGKWWVFLASRSSTYLVAPPGDRGDDVATGRVPLHIRGHVVLCYVHHGAVWRVHKGESSVHAAHTGKEKIIHTQKDIHPKWHKQVQKQYSKPQIRVRIRSSALIRGVRKVI